MAQTEGTLRAKVGCLRMGEQVYLGSPKRSDMIRTKCTNRVVAEARLKSRPAANTKGLAGHAQGFGLNCGRPWRTGPMMGSGLPFGRIRAAVRGAVWTGAALETEAQGEKDASSPTSHVLPVFLLSNMCTCSFSPHLSATCQGHPGANCWKF